MQFGRKTAKAVVLINSLKLTRRLSSKALENGKREVAILNGQIEPKLGFIETVGMKNDNQQQPR